MIREHLLWRILMMNYSPWKGRCEKERATATVVKLKKKKIRFTFEFLTVQTSTLGEFYCKTIWIIPFRNTPSLKCICIFVCIEMESPSTTSSNSSKKIIYNADSVDQPQIKRYLIRDFGSNGTKNKITVSSDDSVEKRYSLAWFVFLDVTPKLKASEFMLTPY